MSIRAVKLWAALALVLGLMVGGAWAYWNFELRWRPKTIDKNQAEIAAILQASGWVSPNLTGQKLYMVAYRDCPDSARFAEREFKRLHKANVDTRVIEIARRDENGVAKSTPAERATVAQLWITRDWKLLEAWRAAPAATWTAKGIPAADGDMARTAVVEAGRSTVDRLTPLLKANGVRFGYPLLVWWNEAGEMRACACDRRETYRFVRKELGA
jgi:hypothetical protein